MTESRVSHYRVVRELGRGAAGVVYEAIDETLRRRVALKVIRAEEQQASTEDGDPGALLQREATVAAGLTHPTLVTVYSFERHGSLALIAMELLDGETLAAALAGGRRYTAAEACELLKSVALGLSVAHDAGVIHRDIKPSNIMVLRAGGVKLLDFGVAMLKANGPSSGSLAGTPGYSAPEQYRTTTLSPACDVYALGATLFELLFGARPFAQRPITMVAALARAGVPPELESPGASAAVPRELLVLLRAALSADPEARPRDAREFVAGLEKFIRAPRPARRTSSRRRRRVVVALASVIALFVVVAATAAVALIPGRSYGNARAAMVAEAASVGNEERVPGAPDAGTTSALALLDSTSPIAGRQVVEPTSAEAPDISRQAVEPTPAEAPDISRQAVDSSLRLNVAAVIDEARRFRDSVHAVASELQTIRRRDSLARVMVRAQEERRRKEEVESQMSAPIRIREGTCPGRRVLIDNTLQVGELPMILAQVHFGQHRVDVVNPETGAIEWQTNVSVVRPTEIVLTPSCAS